MIKMKKIGGKSFWIILVISIVALIILTIGVIFLTRKSSKEFYSAGYIINSTASKSDKLYFKDNTVYKENVFEEYVFKNVDNKEVNVDKNNFIHYLDNSLSFMKNGVILDLDNISTSLVPYYNITDASIIKYNNGGYYIETADKTLVFGNFLGKITDNKYIVVGKDIKIKLAGSNETVSGDYFEILFVEDGVVKIENQEGSYQTVSDGTTIYVGNNIKIDLGDKNVYLDDNSKLSLNEMTIDGNENINITPSDGKVKDDKKDNKGDTEGKDNTSNNPNGNGTDGKENTTPGNNGDNKVDDNENPDDNKTVIKKEVSVDLVSAKAGINSFEANFQVIDTGDFIKGNLIFNVVNTTTGKTVYTKILANSSDIQNVVISSLSPDTNYVMTVSEENNSTGVQYFQKIFRTDTLDLSLVREYVTTDTLSYSIDFGSSNVKSANVSICGSDGKSCSEPVIVSNSDDNTVTFDDLKKNTTYNIKVDSVVFNNLNYSDVYTINTSDTTLKEKPVLGDISVKVSNDGKEFTLLMDKPTDEDKSITKYTYEIYNAKDINEESISTAEPVYSFSSNELKEQKLKLGENGLVSNVDYRFKVVVDYYDNYKNNQIETGYSNYFQIVGKPTLEFAPDDELISFNQIGGVVTIKDEGCTIPNNERKCANKENDFIIKYYGPDNVKKTINGVSFTNHDDNTLTYDLLLKGLTENTLYTFEVYADIDMQNGEGLRSSEYIGSFTAKTDGTKALMMQNWKDNNYSFDTPISVNTEMVSTEPSDNSIDKVSSITFNLYAGNVKNVSLPEPIGSFTTTENIRDLYYNKEFTLTSNMFGIENLDALREISGGKLYKNYTIEVTDAFDETGTNEFTILNNMYVFKTPSILLLEDEVSNPEIIVKEITNNMTNSGDYAGISYDSKLDKDTIRGYKVTANFDSDKISSVLKLVDNPIKNVKFYVYNKDGNVITTKDIAFNNDNTVDAYFFLDYGTDSSVEDNDLRRGNTYKFAFIINLDTDNDGKADSTFPSSMPTSGLFNAIKKDPVFKLYIDNSTSNSITYKYLITDIDNALEKDEESGKYLLYYDIEDNSYSSVIEVADTFKDVTLSNLNSSDIYSISYSRRNLKGSDASKVVLDKYYFDGYHDGKTANLSYSLEYGNFDNRLKIVLEDNDFLDRVSAYLLTLSSGKDKYEKVISDFKASDIKDCGDKKCFIVDYAELTKSDKNKTGVDLKGKDVKVSLKAFYDTGYVGFSQKSLVGDYFKNLGLVSDKDANKVGYLYQNNGTDSNGKYIYVQSNGSNVVFNTSIKPMGILGSELIKGDVGTATWKFNVNNMIDIDNNKFVSFGDINTLETGFAFIRNGIFRTDVGSINLKVVDMVDINTDNNNFKFTSFTPKVSASVSSLINGGIFNIDLSVDEETLKSDFVKTDSKYKFYIDIYKKNVCEEGTECEDETFVKTEETYYDDLGKVVVTGLDPDTSYVYKISADMNKNGTKVKTPLFDNGRSGYVEFKSSFSTLNKDKILKGLNLKYTSSIGDDTYSKRVLNMKYNLYTDVNFDILYEIYDIDGNKKYDGTIVNGDFSVSKSGAISASYDKDISGNDFVFGANYYTLKVYAVTTDLHRKLELYNDVIKQVSTDKIYMDVAELRNPSITVNKQEAIISEDYKHSIKYKITVIDSNRVITDGKYYIELQDTSYKNVCSNPKDCQVTVDMKNNTCTFGNGKSCTVNPVNDGLVVEVTFDNLKADTNYVIYAYADVYRNNVSLNDSEKLSKVYVRKSQYTKSDLGFSLGAVTPTAVSKKEVHLTFVGAANLNEKIKGIEYSITVQGGERIASGVIGKTTNTGSDEITFKLDSDRYPYLDIAIPDGKELGVNNTINITYYYLDNDGNISVLKLGDKTTFDYSFKNENK